MVVRKLAIVSAGIRRALDDAKKMHTSQSCVQDLQSNLDQKLASAFPRRRGWPATDIVNLRLK
jgi:hypothetical protein